MPQLFKIGPYIVYFWSNEGFPQEPVHVHVREGRPSANATKFWITKSGKTLLANNNSCIREKDLRLIQRIVEANSESIINAWKRHFDTSWRLEISASGTAFVGKSNAKVLWLNGQLS